MEAGARELVAFGLIQNLLGPIARVLFIILKWLTQSPWPNMNIISWGDNPTNMVLHQPGKDH